MFKPKKGVKLVLKDAVCLTFLSFDNRKRRKRGWAVDDDQWSVLLIVPCYCLLHGGD